MSVDNVSVETNIDDEKVKDDISYILNTLKYKYIDELGDNGIYFARQTSLQFVHGIVYSKYMNKPDWGTVEVLEKINDNLYYYKGY
ncbi:MAG TPA: hypothetical protein VEG39_02960 [Clostridia bacterium]|nr:hypothetical protein [Clostridia bacterium]